MGKAKRSGIFSILRNETGSNLVELAISLFMLTILSAGMSDVWKLSRESEVIVDAARHGARAAGAQAYTVALSDVNAACNYTSGNSVLTTAVSLTATYLQAISLETYSGSVDVVEDSGNQLYKFTGTDFQITSDFTTVCEDSRPRRSVRVRIEALSDTRCVICFQGMFVGVTLDQEAVFALEADCGGTCS